MSLIRLKLSRYRCFSSGRGGGLRMLSRLALFRRHSFQVTWHIRFQIAASFYLPLLRMWQAAVAFPFTGCLSLSLCLCDIDLQLKRAEIDRAWEASLSSLAIGGKPSCHVIAALSQLLLVIDHLLQEYFHAIIITKPTVVS